MCIDTMYNRALLLIMLQEKASFPMMVVLQQEVRKAIKKQKTSKRQSPPIC